MDVKVSKDKQLADGLIERISSMLDEIESKTVHKDTKKMIDRGKGSKTLTVVKPVKNISKNLQSFLKISPAKKEALTPHKLGDHTYEY